MDKALTGEQIEQFNRDGYLVFRRLATQTICDRMLSVAKRHLRDAIAPVEYEAELGYPGAPDSLDAPGGRTIRRLRAAYQRDACYRTWADDAGLQTKLAQLLNEPVRVALAHHNCVMTKHPNFGTATSWHRDIRYWSFTRPDLISVWLALGPETPINGGLKFIPGSHRLKIEAEQLDALDFLRPDLPQNQLLFAQGLSLELQKGDVVFFHSGLFHAAGRNDGGTTKISVVFAYRGQSNLPLAGSRSEAGESTAAGLPPSMQHYPSA